METGKYLVKMINPTKPAKNFILGFHTAATAKEVVRHANELFAAGKLNVTAEYLGVK